MIACWMKFMNLIWIYLGNLIIDLILVMKKYLTDYKE